VCVGERDKGQAICWSTPGERLDRAIEAAFLEAVAPDELELSLAVEGEAARQAEELDRQWRARIEQAGYEARRAERRYKAVDPDNRVVARTLEHEWEQRLRDLEEVERLHQESRHQKRVELSQEDREQIRALAKDLPAVWRAETTRPADRKAMLRLVIEGVSIRPEDVPRRITRVRLQWQSGVVTDLEVDRPSRRERTRTPERALERIREMSAAGLNDMQMAKQLNAECVTTGAGKEWNVWAVRWARRGNGIPRIAPDAPRSLPGADRHPDGRYSVVGAAKRLGVSVNVIRGWLRKGLLSARQDSESAHPRAWWIEIDDQTAARMAEIPRRHSQRAPAAERNGQDEDVGVRGGAS
jgi:hypothetical protein